MRLFYFSGCRKQIFVVLLLKAKNLTPGGFSTKRVKMQIFKGDIFDRSCRPCSTKHHHMMPCLSIPLYTPVTTNAQKQLFNNMLNCWSVWSLRQGLKWLHSHMQPASLPLVSIYIFTRRESLWKIHIQHKGQSTAWLVLIKVKIE